MERGLTWSPMGGKWGQGLASRSAGQANASQHPQSDPFFAQPPVAKTVEGCHGGVSKCRMGVTSKLDSGMGGTSHLHLSSTSSQLRGRHRPSHIFTHVSMNQPATAIPPGGLQQTLQHLGSIRNTSADEGVPLSSAWRILKGLQPSPVFRPCLLGLFFSHEWLGCV